MQGVALVLLPSLVTTISFNHSAADMIREPEDLMWCWCARPMECPQSTNTGSCALQVTVAKEPFHTAELEIGLTVAKSTQSTPHPSPTPVTGDSVTQHTHNSTHMFNKHIHTFLLCRSLSFSLSIFLPSLHYYPSLACPLSFYSPPFFSQIPLFLTCSFSLSFIKMDFLKPPFVLLTAPLSIGLGERDASPEL